MNKEMNSKPLSMKHNRVIKFYSQLPLMFDRGLFSVILPETPSVRPLSGDTPQFSGWCETFGCQRRRKEPFGHSSVRRPNHLECSTLGNLRWDGPAGCSTWFSGSTREEQEYSVFLSILTQPFPHNGVFLSVLDRLELSRKLAFWIHWLAGIELTISDHGIRRSGMRLTTRPVVKSIN